MGDGACRGCTTREVGQRQQTADAGRRVIRLGSCMRGQAPLLCLAAVHAIIL